MIPGGINIFGGESDDSPPKTLLRITRFYRKKQAYRKNRVHPGNYLTGLSLK